MAHGWLLSCISKKKRLRKKHFEIVQIVCYSLLQLIDHKYIHRFTRKFWCSVTLQFASYIRFKLPRWNYSCIFDGRWNNHSNVLEANARWRTAIIYNYVFNVRKRTKVWFSFLRFFRNKKYVHEQKRSMYPYQMKAPLNVLNSLAFSVDDYQFKWSINIDKRFAEQWEHLIATLSIRW